MNTGIAKVSQRPAILDLWWLRARMAAAGQNFAAERAARRDAWFTLANIILPTALFALSVFNGSEIKSKILPSLSIAYALIFMTAITFVVAAWQYIGDFKSRSIYHRQARNNFEDLYQQIEMSGFEIEDDIAFIEIAEQIKRIRRNCERVPERDWVRARKDYKKDIKYALSRLRPQPIVPTDKVEP